MGPRNLPLLATLGWQQVWGLRHCRDMDAAMPCRRRCQMRCRVLIAVMGILLAVATVAKAEQLGALLTGYEESPSVSTAGTGEFTATIAPDGEVIQYTMTFSGLQGTVTQGHI